MTQPDAAECARREALIAEHVEAENRHDVQRTLNTMGPEPRYEVPGLGGVFVGQETVGAFLGGFFAAFPNIQSTAERFYHAPDATIVEVRSVGTHEGEFEGIPANGKPLDLRTIGVFPFDGKVMTGEKVYSNDLILLRQITSDDELKA